MSVPHADSPDHEARTEVQAHVVGRARRPAHPPRAAASAADPQLHLIGAASADALMLAMLTLFNESDDMDGTIQQSLDMLTTALGGRIGEIWLVGGEARQVELRYSSSDGSRAAAAFAAAGRSLAPDTAPALVGRVLRTGRGSTAEVSGGEGSSERAAQAAEAGIRAASPSRSGPGTVLPACWRSIVRRSSARLEGCSTSSRWPAITWAASLNVCLPTTPSTKASRSSPSWRRRTRSPA